MVQQGAFGHSARGRRRAVVTRLAIAVALVLAAAPAARAKAAPEPAWTFSLAPYIWLPAMTGNATVDGHTVEVDTTIGDIFTENDFAFAVQAEAEAWYKKKVGLAFNGQWAILKQNDNSAGPAGCPPPADPCIFPIDFDLKVNMGLFEIVGLYDPGEWVLGSGASTTALFFQPLLGARFTIISMDIDSSGPMDPGQTKAWADPILGARFGVRFGPERRFAWLMRGDFGGFTAGSDFTWNLVGMLTWDFHMRSVRSSLALGARGFYQDFEDSSGAKEFRWDVIQYGPLLAWNFYF